MNNKVVNNAKWIIICRIAQSLLQLVIGMLSARYLGPENYGLINYAGSVVAFVVPFTQLGLNATLVRELIDSPEREGEIMGTSLCLSSLCGCLGVMTVCAAVLLMNPGEIETLIVCGLYSLSLIFRGMELIQYWFHSKLQSKYPSIAMVISYVVVSLYKIYLLVFAKSIFWFAVVHSIEYGIVAFLLLFIYRRQKNQAFSVSGAMARRLLKRSKFYILSSMMVTLFQNTDHIMLRQIAGDAENGFYSAAITCAGVCQFVYTAIIDSARPSILTCKKEGGANYEKNISRLYCVIIYLALMQGVGMTLFSRMIVSILYGEQYMPTAPVLRLLVWYVGFSYMGSVRNIWILAEGKQSMLWKINLAGACANILLNLCLIPLWGASGAAFASLMTQAFTNFILNFLHPALRTNSRLILKGLDPRLILEFVRKRG